eukprot:gene5408-9492_t
MAQAYCAERGNGSAVNCLSGDAEMEVLYLSLRRRRALRVLEMCTHHGYAT